MASNNSTFPVVNPIFALSIRILNAQKISNIVWAILCIFGFSISSLQLTTILLWKPLRKMDQILIFNVALGDLFKAFGYGIVAVKRLYLTATNQPEVASQRMCLIWIIGIPMPTHFVHVLLVMISVDRALALLIPIWYKNQNIRFKLILIGISIFVGLTSGFCSLIESSDDLFQPICAYASSPTENYRTFATWFENSTAILTLLINLISCIAVLVRYRLAIKAKKDMKVFKKNIQLNALKTLLAVVGLFLISSAMGTLWFTLINVWNWDDAKKLSYTPLGGCFTLIRGVLDFPLYIMMVKEYRKGFLNIFFNWKCLSKNNIVSSVAPLVTGASKGHSNTLAAVNN